MSVLMLHGIISFMIMLACDVIPMYNMATIAITLTEYILILL